MKVTRSCDEASTSLEAAPADPLDDENASGRYLAELMASRPYLSSEELGEAVDVHGDTVDRWLRGETTPHRRNRKKVEAFFNVPGESIWGKQTARQGRSAERKRVQRLTDLNEQEVLGQVEGVKQANFAGYDLGFILLLVPDLLIRLAEQVTTGAIVEFLIIDPRSHHCNERDVIEEVAEGTTRCHAQNSVRRIAQSSDLSLRTFDAQRDRTILRLDDWMLIVTHDYGTPVEHSDMEILRRQLDPRRFDRLLTVINALPVLSPGAADQQFDSPNPNAA